MDRNPIRSSSLKSIGYDPETRDMDVEFRATGNIFRYHDVAPELHQRIVDHKSPGSVFARKIPKRHLFTRLPKENE